MRITMEENAPVDDPEKTPDRWMLIRDVAVFQLKLLFDGFRDLLLVPVSLIAGIVSLVRGGDKPGPEFYNLLKFGRGSEQWINLFGAASHWHGTALDDEKFAAGDVDELVSRVETFVVDEYRKGGVTAQAKARLDVALDALHRLTRRDSSAD